MPNRPSFSFSITIALMAVSAIVSLVSNLGSTLDVLIPLLIASPGSGGLREVLAGEVWRLITPIFIHFGPLHLLFNMMWLWDLGNLVEFRRGRAFYLVFVVIVGVVANLAQYFMGPSPVFGGMSGVVYGLLGYVWIQGRFNRWFGYALHKHIVVMMLIWYVLCWTGLVGPIANWAHTARLMIGVSWGYVSRRHK
jgi:GlpG protein